MPISSHVPIRRISQLEFGELSFEVMRHVFAIHNDIGRLFDETIYKRELAHRMPGVRLEEPIDVSFDSFQKRYFIDVLVGDGALFEFKAVEAISPRHRAQLLHYLLLCDAGHGKVINVRPADVQHEFVNSNWMRADRNKFTVRADRWNANLRGLGELQNYLTAMLHDLGTGLGTALYEEALTHFFGGTAQVEADVAVRVDGRQLGHQRCRLIAPGVALRITGFNGPLDAFEVHARRLLAHIDLRAIAWVNINMKEVTLTTLQA